MGKDQAAHRLGHRHLPGHGFDGHRHARPNSAAPGPGGEAGVATTVTTALASKCMQGYSHEAQDQNLDRTWLVRVPNDRTRSS